MRWPTIWWEHEKSGWNLFTKHCVVEVPSTKEERGLSTLGGVGKGKILKDVPYHAMIAKRKPTIKTLIQWFQRSEFKFSRKQFKVDRLEIIVVAKKYIYVSQLFISRMPKMRAIPQLVSIIVYMDFSTEVFFSCYLRVTGTAQREGLGGL